MNLGSGYYFTTLQHVFFYGVSTISGIVAGKTTWNVQYITCSSLTNEWLQISDRYEELWNIPNSMGSMAGTRPINSGPSYMNYEQFSSVTLLGFTDTDGLLSLISVVGLGKNSDGTFCIVADNHWRDEFPSSSTTNEEETPNFLFCFVTNEAFLLSRHIVRSFTERALIKEHGMNISYNMFQI